ncbi:hypothetical protein N7540_013098 [Penicillium herquei]|nr:hypothetical protein N7540_013098 [Penicillium herquei]
MAATEYDLAFSIHMKRGKGGWDEAGYSMADALDLGVRIWAKTDQMFRGLLPVNSRVLAPRKSPDDFHLPPVRPETPPSPLSTVPFARDPDFVGRDTLLHQIHEKSSVPGSRIALVGLGGVGKSQLTIEYSYQVRSQSPAKWVFWVHASTEARFEQSFRDIADQIKLPGCQDPKVNIFKLVENWLRDENRGKWLLILDNVDNDQLLCPFSVAGKEDLISSRTNTSTKPQLEYIPRSRNGSIIITSRTRDVALKMTNHNNLIEVKPMEESEALELLQKKLDQPGESQEGPQLVNALELMPLAVVQAASYIRNRAPRYSAGHLYRDWEAKNSFLVTWQISFDYIRQTKPSAADLLSLMSMFDRQGISENLIQDQPKANDTSISELQSDLSDGETSESDSGPDFEDDVTTLRDFSFISVSEDKIFFTMHRLVQLTMRAWLKSHGQVNHWRKDSSASYAKSFPPVNTKTGKDAGHSFLASKPQCHNHQYRLSVYNNGLHCFAEVHEMAAKSRDQRVVLLGEEHEEVLDSTSMLATAYWLDGRWKEAEQLEVQVMETRRTKLGADHPSTLTSRANLGSTYGKQGRWEDAGQLFVQVMKMSKMKLGADHPSTLMSMGNLASTYAEQGRWEEAKQLNVQVMEISKTKLGEDHPSTLTAIANLASIYRNQGHWSKAEQLEIQVLERSQTKLGADHPDTLMSMGNLASTYWSQGRWEEAKQLNLPVM